MRKGIPAVLFAVVMASALSALGAIDTTYRSKWFGFITSSEEIDKRKNITPDEVRKSVADKKGQYVLYNGLLDGYLRLQPQDKAAPFAGQQVWAHGSITSNSLTKASRFVAGSSSPNTGGPFTISVTSIERFTGPDDNIY